MANIYESESGFIDVTVESVTDDNDHLTGTRPEDGDGIVLLGELLADIADVTNGFLDEILHDIEIIGDTIVCYNWQQVADNTIAYIVGDVLPKIDCSATGEAPGLQVKNKPFFIINQTPNTYQLSLSMNGPPVSFCMPGVNCSIQLWKSIDAFLKNWDGYFDPSNYKAWSLDNLMRNLPTIKAFLEDLNKWRWVTIGQLLGIANKAHSVDIKSFGDLLKKAIPILEKLAVEFYKYSMDAGSKVDKLVPIVNLIKAGIDAYTTINQIIKLIEQNKPLIDKIVKLAQVWSNPTILMSLVQDTLQDLQAYATQIANQQFEFLKEQILSVKVQIPELVAKAVL